MLFRSCRENEVLIFSYELHCDTTRSNVTHTPTMTITDYNKIITALALGKTFNVGGVPISQIIIDDEELKKYGIERLGLSITLVLLHLWTWF